MASRGLGLGLCALLAGCSSSEASSQALEQAPLELAGPCVVALEADARPVVRLALGAGEPLRFLVDTGSSISLISARRAEEQGRVSRPYASAFETTGSSGRSVQLARYVRVERLELGALVVRGGRLTVLEDSALDVAGVDGILGQDLLARLVLVLDMQRRALHLLPQGGPEAVSAYLSAAGVGDGAWARAEIEFRPRPFLPLDVAGLEAGLELELDTGAEGTSLPAAALAALALEPTGTHTLGAVGGSFETRSYQLEGLDLFGLKLSLRVTEAATEFGLLGMDVLGELVLVLDGPARTLWLHRRS